MGFYCLNNIILAIIIKRAGKNWSVDAIQAAIRVRWAIFLSLVLFELFIIENLHEKIAYKISILF